MENEPTDRNVFILGAGFSAHAGVPLIKGFLDKSRELMDDPSSRLDPLERDLFKRVFEFRREMAQACEKVAIDLDNMEELFGLVEMSQRLGGEQRETRNATVYVIAKTLELATKPAGSGRNRVRFYVKTEFRDHFFAAVQGGAFQNPPGYGQETFSCDMYEYFAGLAVGVFDQPQRRAARNATIITFNYDLILDHALQSLRICPEYALDAGLTREHELPGAERGCLVLKLHGSTNWGICGSCEQRIVVLQGKVTDTPEQFRQEICDKCGAQRFQPLLVPPSWDKSEYQTIMKPVWARAVAELGRATRICVIGYSMPQSDLFFKYLLTLALSQNHGLYKLVVVDFVESPAAEPFEQAVKPACNLESRYHDLLNPLFRERRFSFHQEGFEHFVCSGLATTLLGRGEILGGSVCY
jgi:NAD-dependent SIR2 family protein deacetylase